MKIYFNSDEDIFANDFKAPTLAEEFDLLMVLRETADLCFSQIPPEKKKNKDGSRRISGNGDVAYAVYTKDPDLALMLHMDQQLGELRDICFRGGEIEDIICMTSGNFPPDAVSKPSNPELAVMWFYPTGEKCARCWKRYPEINEEELCQRCDSVLKEVSSLI